MLRQNTKIGSMLERLKMPVPVVDGLASIADIAVSFVTAELRLVPFESLPVGSLLLTASGLGATDHLIGIGKELSGCRI